MAKEIERKFLVASDDWRVAADCGTCFLQAYIVTMDDRSVRVRLMDDKRAKLTIKIGTGSMTRDEFEYEISVADARDMMAMAVGLVIEKPDTRSSTMASSGKSMSMAARMKALSSQKWNSMRKATNRSCRTGWVPR